MTRHFLLSLTLILTACSVDKKRDCPQATKIKISAQDSLFSVKRQEIRPFTIELTKKLNLPILADSIHFQTSDTSSFSEYRITMVSGGHSMSNVGCVFRLLYGLKSNKNYLETYIFRYNKNFSSPFIDSVKQVTNIPLDNAWEIYQAFDKACFLDHQEFSNYQSTGGGHIVYEFFIKHKDNEIEYKRVVKTAQSLSEVNDVCFKLSKLDPQVIFE